MKPNTGILNKLKPPRETLFILNQGAKGYINIKVGFLVIITILSIDHIIKMKDILLYNSDYNRHIICREDWLINVKPVLPDI